MLMLTSQSIKLGVKLWLPSTLRPNKHHFISLYNVQSSTWSSAESPGRSNWRAHLSGTLMPAHRRVATRRRSRAAPVGPAERTRKTQEPPAGELGASGTRLTSKWPLITMSRSFRTVCGQSEKPVPPAEPLFSLCKAYIVEKAAMARPTWKPRLFSIRERMQAGLSHRHFRQSRRGKTM